MFFAILRGVGSVLAGLVFAFVFVVAAEGFSSIYHPVPPGVDADDYLEICKHVARYPTWVLAVCAGIWAVGPFAGAWLATRLGTARHPIHGIIVGAILLALAGLNMTMLPYPSWFPVFTLLTFCLGPWLGIRLARGATRPQA
jgi:hypothetical protein